jgi:hypothetical protein
MMAFVVVIVVGILKVVSFFCTYAYRVRKLFNTKHVSYSKMWQGEVLNHQVLLCRKSVLSPLRADNLVSTDGSPVQPWILRGVGA